MARLPRLSIPGQVHYVLQRGHAASPVFINAADRAQYRQAMWEAMDRHQVVLLAYALLDGEVHFLARPSDASGLSLAMQAIGRAYVAGFNRRHGRKGTLFDGRFRAALLQPGEHVLAALVYVNGLGAVMPPEVDEAAMPAAALGESSAAHLLGLQVEPRLALAAEYWALANTPFGREAAFEQLLQQGSTPGFVRRLQQACRGGWLMGSPEFAATLMPESERALAPKPRGRPKKMPSENLPNQSQ